MGRNVVKQSDLALFVFRDSTPKTERVQPKGVLGQVVWPKDTKDNNADNVYGCSSDRCADNKTCGVGDTNVIETVHVHEHARRAHPK